MDEHSRVDNMIIGKIAAIIDPSLYHQRQF